MTSEERHFKRYQNRVKQRQLKRETKNKKYDNYEIINNIYNIQASFLECKKGVSWKHSTQFYEKNLLKNIINSKKMLENNILPTKGFQEFYINERGKTRHIKAPHISERVIQKIMCDKILIPILSRCLIYDNGANIKGKGTDFSRRRLVQHLTSYRRKYGQDGFALIIDYQKYFDNIDHDILIKEVKKYIKDERVLSLYTQSINEFGTVGLGLGSQVSQISSIFYPNKIDHYIKEVLKIKYYGRYMDDSYLIHQDKKYLEYCLQQIKALCNSLNIKLNAKKTRIIKLKNGVPFLKCKYVFSNSGKIIKCGGRESAKRMRRKLKKLFLKAKNGEISLKEVGNNYKSWRGYFLKFDNRKMLNNIDKFYDNLLKRFIYE